MHWCGGLTELRLLARWPRRTRSRSFRTAAGAAAPRISSFRQRQQPVVRDVPPGARRPEGGLQRFEEDNQITRGPEGIYMRPSDRPGFGWEYES